MIAVPGPTAVAVAIEPGIVIRAPHAPAVTMASLDQPRAADIVDRVMPSFFAVPRLRPACNRGIWAIPKRGCPFRWRSPTGAPDREIAMRVNAGRTMRTLRVSAAAGLFVGAV